MSTLRVKKRNEKLGSIILPGFRQTAAEPQQHTDNSTLRLYTGNKLKNIGKKTTTTRKLLVGIIYFWAFLAGIYTDP